MFIFDVLPLAERWTVVETSRREEFVPLKNATGADSPETVRAGAERPGRRLAAAGRGDAWPTGAAVEISPLFALDAEELAEGRPRERSINELVFSPGHDRGPRRGSEAQFVLGRLPPAIDRGLAIEITHMLHAMIMAGGGGTRFWPRSRAERPKQFLTLAGDRTLLQQALRPHRGAGAAERTWVITGGAASRRGAPSSCRTCRPTASSASRAAATPPPCIGLGAALIARHDPDAVMLVMPADHVIEPVAGVPPGRPRRRADGRGASARAASPSASRRPSRPPATATSTAARRSPGGRACRRLPGAGVPREAGRRPGRAVRRLRRVLLEQRHLRLEGRDDPRRAADAASRSCSPPSSASPTPGTRRARRRPAQRVRGAREDQHRLRRHGARAEKCWWCRRRIAGTTSAAGWPWSGCTRRTPTATPCWRTHCGLDTTGLRHRRRRRADLIATIGVEQPAHHPGRRRHPGRRPPRRGHGQAARRAAEEARAWRSTCERPRCSGVDYGTVRVGLAVSDPDRSIASPLTTSNAATPRATPSFFAS